LREEHFQSPPITTAWLWMRLAAYQVAIQVPSPLADGDWPLVASIGGVASPGGVVLSVKQ
jgi:uncharacterized protein (TIGR03437 family)